MKNKKECLPDIMELRLERFNYCSEENRKKDGCSLYLRKMSIYARELIKISNLESYIFITEKALKLILHINTFENYEFDINDNFCLRAYKLISRAIKDFEEVKDVFCFWTEDDGILKIKCLTSKMIFPADNIQVDAIRDYMKYNTFKPQKCSSIIQASIKKYVPFREVLFKYRIWRILKELRNESSMCTQNSEVNLEDEFFVKCREMYNILEKRKTTNSCRDVSIDIISDEITGKPEIYIKEGNTIIPSENLNLDDWLNANIGLYDIQSCILCLKEIVEIQYYNKKTEVNTIQDKEPYMDEEPDMFTGLDEIGRENLINMLES